MLRSLLPLVGIVLVAACDLSSFNFLGPAAPQVDRIRVEIENSSGTFLAFDRTYAYDSDGRLEEVDHDGDLTDRYDYEAGLLNEVRRRSDLGTTRLRYESSGGLVIAAEQSDDAFTHTIDLGYFNGDPRFFQEIVIDTQLENSDRAVNSESRYGYDGSRLTSITTDLLVTDGEDVLSDTRQRTTYDYDDSGRHKRTEVEFDDGDEVRLLQSLDVDLKEDGTVDEIEDTENDIFYTVTYDDQGRIDEIEQALDGQTITTSYRYNDDKNTTGGYFPSALPVPFDLRGKSIDAVGFNALDIGGSFFSGLSEAEGGPGGPIGPIDPQPPREYPEGPYGAGIGDVVEPFEFPTPEGTFSFDADVFALGAEVLVVNAVAGFCEPCIPLALDLRGIHDDYAGLGVVVLGMYVANAGFQAPDAQDVNDWVDGFGLNYPVAYDPEILTFEFAEQLPATIVIDVETMTVAYAYFGNDVFEVEDMILQVLAL